MAAPPPPGPPPPSGRRHSQYDSIPMTNRPTAAKVPIPRLNSVQRRNSKGGTRSGRDDSPGSPAEQIKRVPHACDPCRQRKTKCSGERPICKHCIDFKLPCMYGDGKRDRAKNEMAELKQRVEIYETLLSQLKGQVDSAGQLAIAKALQGLRTSESPSPMRVENRDGESLVSADVGSTGSVDHIREDINSDVWNTIGYMGKSSEVAWIQRVAQQLAREAQRNSPPLPGEGISTATSSGSQTSSYSYHSTKFAGYDAIVDEEYQLRMPAYHLDDVVMSHTAGNTDPFLLPDRAEADALVKSYFSTMYSTYPILNKKTFTEQYEQFFTLFFPPDNSKRWLAMLNLIFAIGCLYGKLTNESWTDGDHLKYFNRARALSLDENNIFELADLQQVQIIGLTGMYLLASNQTNRAWNVIGLAVRYAQTLGLNLRNEVPELGEEEKEMRARIWFALYSVEHLLCLMTGRPSCIRDVDCSVSLPRPIDEDLCHFQPSEDALRAYASEQPTSTPSSVTSFPNLLTPLSHIASRTPATSNNSRSPVAIATPPQNMFQPTSMSPNNTVSDSAMYFIEHVKLTRITSNVLSSLYSPGTINHTWSDIQGIISNLELTIQKWRRELPPALSLDPPPYLTGQSTQYRIALAFQYHHARILINRPCLCRLDHRIPNESARSRGFNRSAATTCISAAREIIALIPDQPNPVLLISTAPWWCLLHYLVAAAAILMVEISMRAEHNPQQAEGLLADSKKVVRWLRAMAPGSMAAERSFTVLSKLLIVSAPKIGGDTRDVERDTPTQNVPIGIVSQQHQQQRHQLQQRQQQQQQQKQRHQQQEHGYPAQAQAAVVAAAAAEMPYIFRGYFDDPNVMPFGYDSAGTVAGFGPPPHTPLMAQPIPQPHTAVNSTMASPSDAASMAASMTATQSPIMPVSAVETALHQTLPIHSQHPQAIPPPPQILPSSFSPMNPAGLSHPMQLNSQRPTSQQQRQSPISISPPQSEPVRPPRTQKRLSLGVSNISLPPPPDLQTVWQSSREEDLQRDLLTDGVRRSMGSGNSVGMGMGLGSAASASGLDGIGTTMGRKRANDGDVS